MQQLTLLYCGRMQALQNRQLLKLILMSRMVSESYHSSVIKHIRKELKQPFERLTKHHTSYMQLGNLLKLRLLYAKYLLTKLLERMSTSIGNLPN